MIQKIPNVKKIFFLLFQKHGKKRNKENNIFFIIFYGFNKTFCSTFFLRFKNDKLKRWITNIANKMRSYKNKAAFIFIEIANKEIYTDHNFSLECKKCIKNSIYVYSNVLFYQRESVFTCSFKIWHVFTKTSVV